MERYTGFAPCPCCFESNGYEGSWHTDWESGPYWWPSRTPCSECEGTGMVESDEPRTLDDLESEEWSADTAAWVASIGELVSGREVA